MDVEYNPGGNFSQSTLRNKVFSLISEKEVMRHFMAYQKIRHDRALNRILGGIIRNEEGFENAPPIQDILADVDDIRYQYMLAEWHFGKGDFAQGMQLLSQIDQWQLYQENAKFYSDQIAEKVLPGIKHTHAIGFNMYGK